VNGYRSEFLELAEEYKNLSPQISKER